jgi:hypothetical protein
VDRSGIGSIWYCQKGGRVSLAPLIVPASLGFLLSLLILKHTDIPNKKLMVSIIATPIGLAFTSVIVFWSYVVNASQAKTLSIMISAAMLIILLLLYVRRNGHSKTDLNPLETPQIKYASSKLDTALNTLALLVFIYSLFQYGLYFVSESISKTFLFGGWDARYFWNLKASFYFRSPELWKGMFDPALSWSHTDYPLMLPGAVAWGWNWLGDEILMWPILVELVFALSLCFVIVWFLKSYAVSWAGYLAGSLFLNGEVFRFWSVAQYADIPFCFFISTAAILVMVSMKCRSSGVILLSGLLAGLSAWTKNEGLSFVLCISFVLLTFLFFNKKNSRPFWKSILIPFAVGVALPLTTTLFMKMTFDPLGNEYVGPSRDFSDFIKNIIDPTRIKILASAYLAFMRQIPEWSGLWFFSVVAICLQNKNIFRSESWIFLVLALSLQFIYFPIIASTPYGLVFQIQTSLQRLLMHSAPLAILYTFYVMGQRLTPNRSL